MSSIIAAIIATLVTAPMLAWIIAFMISKKIVNQRGASARIATDSSTLFFIMSVHYIGKEIWGVSFFLPILLVIIVIAVGFLLLQWKMKQDIDILKLCKSVWRCNFVLFAPSYFILIILGTILNVIHVFKYGLFA